MKNAELDNVNWTKNSKEKKLTDRYNENEINLKLKVSHSLIK